METKTQRTLNRILDTLGSRMCEAVSAHCITGKELMPWAIPITAEGYSDRIQDMPVMSHRDSMRLLSEYSAVVCMTNGAHLLTGCNESDTPLQSKSHVSSCRVDAGGGEVGIFHTHPIGLPIPSNQDIHGSRWTETSYHFIGGKVAGKPVVFGYALKHPESYVKHAIYAEVQAPTPIDDPPEMPAWIVQSVLNASDKRGIIAIHSDEAQVRGFDARIAELSTTLPAIAVRWCDA